MKVGKHNIELSNEEKQLFPKKGYTKGDVIQYYTNMAEHILPHLENRPLMMQRFPDGIGTKGFFQKEISDYFPDWIADVKVKKEGGYVHHVCCNNKATLVYLANQGTITFHTWLSLAGNVHKPDKFVIDLDPPAASDFGLVREGAFKVKQLWDDLDILSYVMTTGSKGVHVVVPLNAKSTYDEAVKVGGKLSHFMVAENKEIFTTARLKEKRGDKLFFDVQRNAYAQTSVAPYSLRASETAPVATPLAWHELSDKNIHAQSFNIVNIKSRIDHTKDPWAGFKRHAVSLNSIEAKLKPLAEQ